MNSDKIISKIFGNSTSMKSSLVVDKLIESGIAVCSELAELMIDSWVKEGLLTFENRTLTIAGPSTQEIKQAWFKLRQMEKTNPDTIKFKIIAESFERHYGWAYYILNDELRSKCEAIGYVSKPEQRPAFQKLLQS